LRIGLGYPVDDQRSAIRNQQSAIVQTFAGSTLAMNIATLVGFLLIILGAIALAFEGISYTKRRETVRVGPIGATVEQRETIPMSPVLGGVALIAGIALVVAGRRGRRSS
jgi:uncharacterized membrane protein